ncbi:hypothetical protein PC117_g6306 [Phytophthora cactorum]|uniref:Uncharacterized protein n=1 Tax=Phytophthora cactorum TaxID=29920 RepID=A0A8T1E3M4_9STRA|nr:hypothetical protein PC117_g6306 [Phytophthora cactorum]
MIEETKRLPKVKELALRLQNDQLQHLIDARKDPAVFFHLLDLNWFRIIRGSAVWKENDWRGGALLRKQRKWAPELRPAQEPHATGRSHAGGDCRDVNSSSMLHRVPRGVLSRWTKLSYLSTFVHARHEFFRGFGPYACLAERADQTVEVQPPHEIHASWEAWSLHLNAYQAETHQVI